MQIDFYSVVRAMFAVRAELADEYVTPASVFYRVLKKAPINPYTPQNDQKDLDTVNEVLLQAVACDYACVYPNRGCYRPILNCGMHGLPEKMSDEDFAAQFTRVTKFIERLWNTRKIKSFGYFNKSLLWSVNAPFKDEADATQFLNECFDRHELAGNYGAMILCIGFKRLMPSEERLAQLRNAEMLRDAKENPLTPEDLE
jgi:hypothetical protein